MKKIIILNSIIIAIGFAFYTFIMNLLQPSWLAGITFLAFPILAGALTALAQNKNRSYDYLPNIIMGAVFYSFLVIFCTKIYIFIAENLSSPWWADINPFDDPDEVFAHLALIGIYVLGGLVGIVIRGVNEVFLPKQRLDLNHFSKRTYYIITVVLLALMSSGAFFASKLDKNIWVCEDEEWIKDGKPKYEQPDVACINGTPYFWNDGLSGLEISYPESWRGKIKISHEEEENKRVVRFDYKNPNSEDKLIFSVSIYQKEFGLKNIYSLSNERPILKSDEYIIAVSEGSIPSEEGNYATFYYEVDEVINAMRFRDGKGERIETRPDVYWQYKDDEYGFSIDYPSNLKVKVINDDIRKYSERMGGGEELINKVITFFVPNGGPGMASINIVDNSDVNTLDEWLAKKNERLTRIYEGRDGRYLRMVVEDKIDIDGIEAMVVYQESDMESYEYEKTAVFFNDAKLFTIYARCEDCTKWWEGFKFN